MLGIFRIKEVDSHFNLRHHGPYHERKFPVKGPLPDIDLDELLRELSFGEDDSAAKNAAESVIVDGIIKVLRSFGSTEDESDDDEDEDDEDDISSVLCGPVVTSATVQDEQAHSEACTRYAALDAVNHEATNTVELFGQAWASFVTTSSFKVNLDFLHETLRRNRSLESVKMSHDFLRGMNAQEQVDIFLSIADLPHLHSWTIDAKLDHATSDDTLEFSTDSVDLHCLCLGLQHTRTFLHCIELGGLALLNESHVRQLVCGVASHVRSLQVLELCDILVDTEQVQAGMLDPILHAMVDSATAHPRHCALGEFVLTCRNNELDGPSLISADALGRFIREFPTNSIDLQGLGLTDEHCRVLRWELGAGDVNALMRLDLRRNPGIGELGFEDIADMQTCNPRNPQILVDDPSWAAQLERVHSRGH